MIPDGPREDGVKLLQRAGELLQLRYMIPDALRRLIDAHEPPVVPRVDEPDVYWGRVWADLHCPYRPPPCPELDRNTALAFHKYGLWVMALPPWAEDEFPADFPRLEWQMRLHGEEPKEEVAHVKLPGPWTAVEVIKKPWPYTREGYGGDLLARDLGLQSRFEFSRDQVHEEIIPRAAELFSVPRERVSLLPVRSWCLVAGIFNRLREKRGEKSLPDLSATSSAEMCADAVGKGYHLIAQTMKPDTMIVSRQWHRTASPDTGFRLKVSL